MTDDRRQRLVDVVAEAMALAPADRGAFVRGACRGDEGLEKEALALVAAGVSGFLDDPTLNRKPAGASMIS